MIFITPLKLTQKSKLIKQQDLVPTLAWLTGVPIPRGSLGSPIFREINLEYVGIQISKCVSNDKFEATTQDGIEKEIIQMVETYEEEFTEFNIPLMVFAAILAFMPCYLLFQHWHLSWMSLVAFFRILHIFSQLSTSFIEEEHQVIYFMTMTILMS